MKLRTKKYIGRQKAIRDLIQFKDIRSFLLAGFRMANSHVVKRDIIHTIVELDRQGREFQYPKLAS